jgi:hypothetical protein
MIDERALEITARYLSKLDKSSSVAKWAMDNTEKVGMFVDGYNELVACLNSVPEDSLLLDAMPKTRYLKRALKGKPLPNILEMSQDNFGLGLIEARNPMLHGQKIKHKEIEEPTPYDKAYAIGTPSMDTTDEALGVGTLGHLLERTFYQWARKNKLAPAGGWKKDDWLQALDEGLLLQLVNEDKPILTDYFIKSNQEGGLGWLNQTKLQNFRSKIEELS